MSDTTYLDLDEAVPTIKKTVKIDGKSYNFKEPTVEDFAKDIARMRNVKKSIAALDGLSEEEQSNTEAEMMMNVMLDGVRQAFPDMPEEVMSGLTMSRIAAIRTFIQEEVTKDAEDESGNE